MVLNRVRRLPVLDGTPIAFIAVCRKSALTRTVYILLELDKRDFVYKNKRNELKHIDTGTEVHIFTIACKQSVNKQYLNIEM